MPKEFEDLKAQFVDLEARMRKPWKRCMALDDKPMLINYHLFREQEMFELRELRNKVGRSCRKGS